MVKIWLNLGIIVEMYCNYGYYHSNRSIFYLTKYYKLGIDIRCIEWESFAHTIKN